MPGRLHPLPSAELAEVLAKLDTAPGTRAWPADAERAAVKHFLAVLGDRYPGKSVEVRVPPYAAIQCIAGARHTRGTPPAVVETDPRTWLALARGKLSFDDASYDGRVHASGERSNLTTCLPLT